MADGINIVVQMTIKSIIANFVPPFILQWWHKASSTQYSIIKNPEDHFPKVCKVKDATWEKTYYPQLYGHCKEQCLEVLHPAQYFMEIENAMVYCDSDVVITDKGAYWDKFNDDEFVTWASPTDYNVVTFDRNNIWIRHFKKKEYVSGIVLSLLGTWSYHWGHFLISFISKFFCAGELGLLDQEITLLISEKEDKTILQILDDYLKKYPKVKLKFAKEFVDYKCEKLLFMPSTAPNFNGYKFRLDYPSVVPRYVIDNMNKYVVNPLIEKIKDNKTKYDKVFLPRPGSLRTLTNYEEVHNYFKSLGFVDIEGATLSIEEKADIFYHAKEIVALYGSSLQNTMFCNGARCLVLINYKMSTDTSLYIPQREHLSCWINLAGQDETSDYHSNYTISLEKIKKVYKDFIAFN